jgi:N-acyl-D-aspartate/D-glutamate deacylase
MADNPDLVIRGGSIADGLGGELFEADVAVKDAFRPKALRRSTPRANW